jgi:branched-chain amino acid transport system substrate-binding protein
MNQSCSTTAPSARSLFSAALLAATMLGGAVAAVPARADEPPIKIGVISEESSVAGASISHAAQLAADEINKAGGLNGRQVQIVTYDDHSSAADAVRAYQRAVNDDKVNAVIVSYISEVVLAVEPWAARLKMPTITPGAASDNISKQVHDNYDRFKYMFHGWLTSSFLAQSICDYSHDLLVDGLHMKSTVIMSEDAAWTTPLDARLLTCMPKAGLQVLDHIRFNPDTTDFTPIFRQIEAKTPDVITTGISHVGVQPTVQWHDQQVPYALTGQSSQATTSTFWKDTNGATEGVITATGASPDVAITPKTKPFAAAYAAKFGASPSYDGYSTYDEVYYIVDAIKRAGSTDPDKLVAALEKTDYVGTLGRVEFYGKDDEFTHAMKYGTDYVSGIAIQWQDGKQVCVWPSKICSAKLKFPSFVHVPQQASAK